MTSIETLESLGLRRCEAPGRAAGSAIRIARALSLGARLALGIPLLAGCTSPRVSVAFDDLPNTPMSHAVADHWMEPSKNIAAEITRLLPAWGPISVPMAESIGFSCAGEPANCTYQQGVSRRISGLPEGNAKLAIRVSLKPQDGVSSLQVSVDQQPEGAQRKHD